MNDINKFKLGKDCFYLNNYKLLRKGKVFAVRLEESGSFSKIFVSIKDNEGKETVVDSKDIYDNMQELFNSLANEYNSYLNTNEKVNPPSLLF